MLSAGSYFALGVIVNRSLQTGAGTPSARGATGVGLERVGSGGLSQPLARARPRFMPTPGLSGGTDGRLFFGLHISANT